MRFTFFVFSLICVYAQNKSGEKVEYKINGIEDIAFKNGKSASLISTNHKSLDNANLINPLPSNESSDIEEEEEGEEEEDSIVKQLIETLSKATSKKEENVMNLTLLTSINRTKTGNHSLLSNNVLQSADLESSLNSINFLIQKLTSLPPNAISQLLALLNITSLSNTNSSITPNVVTEGPHNESSSLNPIDINPRFNSSNDTSEVPSIESSLPNSTLSAIESNSIFSTTQKAITMNALNDSAVVTTILNATLSAPEYPRMEKSLSNISDKMNHSVTIFPVTTLFSNSSSGTQVIFGSHIAESNTSEPYANVKPIISNSTVNLVSRLPSSSEDIVNETGYQPDYFIFGVLPNGTIVRKRPNRVIPHVVYGFLENNTLVQKFSNGSMSVIPMEPIIQVMGFDTSENPSPSIMNSNKNFTNVNSLPNRASGDNDDGMYQDLDLTIVTIRFSDGSNDTASNSTDVKEELKTQSNMSASNLSISPTINATNEKLPITIEEAISTTAPNSTTPVTSAKPALMLTSQSTTLKPDLTEMTETSDLDLTTSITEKTDLQVTQSTEKLETESTVLFTNPIVPNEEDVTEINLAKSSSMEFIITEPTAGPRFISQTNEILSSPPPTTHTSSLEEEQRQDLLLIETLIRKQKAALKQLNLLTKLKLKETESRNVDHLARRVVSMAMKINEDRNGKQKNEDFATSSTTSLPLTTTTLQPLKQEEVVEENPIQKGSSEFMNRKEIQLLIHQLEAIQKDPEQIKKLDLSVLKKLQNFENKMMTMTTPEPVLNIMPNTYVTNPELKEPILNAPKMQMLLVDYAVNISRALSSFFGTALKDASDKFVTSLIQNATNLNLANLTNF